MLILEFFFLRNNDGVHYYVRYFMAKRKHDNKFSNNNKLCFYSWWIIDSYKFNSFINSFLQTRLKVIERKYPGGNIEESIK